LLKFIIKMIKLMRTDIEYFSILNKPDHKKGPTEVEPFLICGMDYLKTELYSFELKVSFRFRCQ